ncbi:MAG: hypothetical protein AB2792_00455 [Candidatus Thiodiazotropha sp.]
MRSVILQISVLLFLLSSPHLYAEDNTAQQQKQSATTTSHTKQYSTQPAHKNQRSRKCAIYSGVCPMSRTAKVGDYCVCHTPSGPIHGVVIP